MRIEEYAKKKINILMDFMDHWSYMREKNPEALYPIELEYNDWEEQESFFEDIRNDS